MKLTYPRSHKIEELVSLYEKFRNENPEVYEVWFKRAYEMIVEPTDLAASDKPDPTIALVNRNIGNFLLSEVECNSADGLTSALADFKKLMMREVRQCVIDREGGE